MCVVGGGGGTVRLMPRFVVTRDGLKDVRLKLLTWPPPIWPPPPPWKPPPPPPRAEASVRVNVPRAATAAMASMNLRDMVSLRGLSGEGVRLRIRAIGRTARRKGS